MPAIELNCDIMYGKTLLLRGFAEFISWKNIKNSSDMKSKCIVNDIVDYVNTKNYDTIAWDGDLYKSDSFTHIIYELMNQLKSTTQFVAFKPNTVYDFEVYKFEDGDPKNCELGWYNLKIKKQDVIYLNSVDIPDGLKWYEKNSVLVHHVFQDILKNSNKIDVFYLGGGDIITGEMRNLNDLIPDEYKQKVSIMFLDIPRASFSIDKETGLPIAKLQFLGNKSSSGDPGYYLPIDLKIKYIYKGIKLEFSHMKYLTEYKFT